MCLQVNLSQKKNSNDNLSQERVKKKLITRQSQIKTYQTKNLSHRRKKETKKSLNWKQRTAWFAFLWIMCRKKQGAKDFYLLFYSGIKFYTTWSVHTKQTYAGPRRTHIFVPSSQIGWSFCVAVVVCCLYYYVAKKRVRVRPYEIFIQPL